MAIFHLAHSFVRRSNSSSSLAAAAYNSGQKIEDSEGSSEFSDYTSRGGVLVSAIMLPTGTPAWANNRGELWRRLEAREDKSTRRADAMLAHNFNIALPHELTLEQNIFLAKDYIREQFTRHGYVADWAIHSPDPRGDRRNIHLHILVPLRKIEGESFGKKVRYSKNGLRQQNIAWRKSWANLTNRHLKRYGHKASIDERSLLAQGIKRRPTRHRGPQPRAKQAMLDSLRTLQPPQPVAPMVRTTKQVSADGTITIQRVISGSALNKIGSGNNSNSGSKFTPAMKPSSSKAWPPQALADWVEWGSKQPAKFFAKWSELSEGNAVAGGPSL